MAYPLILSFLLIDTSLFSVIYGLVIRTSKLNNDLARIKHCVFSGT